MKLKKKTAMFLSFAVGTVMFASTAMAEVVSKSGYDQLKDSVKYTADSLTGKVSNYTMDMSFVVKSNGTVVSSETSLGKYDVSKQAYETTSTSTDGPNKRENYSYVDKNNYIGKNSDQNVYYVTEYTSPQENHSFKNPFKEKQAGDVERIADALVGNLKDSVIVTQNPDGSKELSGTLNESQIPALINAIVSLQSKNEFGNGRGSESYLPKITKDIFVKEIKGKMVTSKDGLIQSVLGTGVISGKDDAGKEHTITFELLGKVSNVNSTSVKKPDLSGKTVEKTVEKDYSKLSNPQKFIGKYKTDILIEKDGKFQKIGEKFVDIQEINETSVSGRYYEEYAKGFESYGSNKKDFKFSGKFGEDHFNAPFTASTSSGNNIKGDIYIDQHSAKVNFSINQNMNSNMLSDSQFSRIFD
ncbi:hypothetical protein N4T77_03230 [Clostridium sp. CX1]|uniref:Uncharacterized protein n=1 Tax=Clostridium tanneri TaxID=3037988 RepID=A0ABU4JV72_9CLOT|nr:MULTISPECIES: hypothetical protein [unclassified Clostridium]MCT8975606.1 hypothetical protein [Clostridium sp. CX1]MDW8802006.1 hypothetical protein [Clostridium sp. A1-XYC3]